MISNDVWSKSKTSGLYRYKPTGQYFARVRFGGKLYRKKLGTSDPKKAQRELRDFRDDLGRVDEREGKTSLGKLLDRYTKTLHGAPATLRDKKAIIEKLRKTWFGIDTLPLRTSIKPSLVKGWLSRHYGHHSAAYYNAALTLLRDVLDLAVEDKIIAENPAKKLKWLKRAEPIRLTPTYEQFKQIVADIRGQRFNAEAERSADFVEFLGALGVGQAEAAAVTRAHVDFDAERIIFFRHKTVTGFPVPLFPQARPLVEKLCQGKKPHERLFSINQARKALRNACKRLGFLRELPDGRTVAAFSHRSLRRMFITRAIERGVDVKTIAQWQGHKDGGLLILKTYSHVRAVHSQRMARLMSDGEADNVISIAAHA